MASTGTSASTGMAAAITGTTKGGFFTAPNIGLMAGVLIFIGFFLGAIITMAKFVGTQDNWNAVQPQINKVIGLSIAGMVGFTIAALLYFMQDPNKSIIFTIIIASLSLTMSFIAVSVAAITKSS